MVFKIPKMKKISFNLSFALCFIFLGFLFGLQKKDKQSHLLENEKNTISIFEETSKYVVNINSLQYARTNHFSNNITEVPAGSGSGFIWDNKGHIVTNFHVIQRASKLRVTLSNGKSYPAKIVGQEPKKDIAVLYVQELSKEKNIENFKIANSDEIEAGQKTIAIGSPFGLDQSITVGIVSATERSILGIGNVTIKGMIQTDASINPGNSGGPLLDSRGYLIGMNTMIYSKTGSSSGIGFAVPSNTIKRIVSQIIKFGRIVQVGLGIQAFSSHISRRLGLEGVLVKEVFSHSSGLKGTIMDRYGNVTLGDLIIKVGKTKIKNYDDLYNSLESKKIGDIVTVAIIRNKKRTTLEIKLIDLAQP